ncbi:Uncharacterised protein [Segatella copri]|nr:Uncharacterised protein [Segatella copri]
MLISTKSETLALMVTFPPSGVNLRALSAMVLIMKSVRMRSALTTASVGSTSSFTPCIWKLILPLLTISKSCWSGKLSIRRLSEPWRI